MVLPLKTIHPMEDNWNQMSQLNIFYKNEDYDDIDCALKNISSRNNKEEISRSLLQNDLYQHNTLDHQVIVVGLQSLQDEIYSLTMRQKSVQQQSGGKTPFNRILSWMVCQQNDYFGAASIALILLEDTIAFTDLLGECNHKGFLDGILPPCSMEMFQEEYDIPILSPVTFLADMAVGCLVKGRFTRSCALEEFLSRNVYYDASRTSLMLVATAAISLSKLLQESNVTDTREEYADSMFNGSSD